MRKLLISLFLILPVELFSQTIVSTLPTNKNVVLEEFTGINCGYCPQGHAIANQIAEANPNRVVIINIHSGSYANPQAGQPDFRTPWGSSILNQAGVTGFPAGTVNRHVFPGYEMTSGQTAMGRGSWINASNIILVQASYLNIGATAQIDFISNLLTVYVEVYYTATSPVGTNKLNIALLQNNTIGYQAGGSSNYNHMHRLVHLLSGQWGAQISSTTQGSLHTQTFTYTIPKDYNSIPAMIEDMEVAVFVAEGNQEVVNGILVVPEFVNTPATDFTINSSSVPEELNTGIFTPTIEVKSYGSQTLSSLNISYQVNDETPVDYLWTGALNFGEKATITLPQTPEFILFPQNTAVISIVDEDGTPENNTISKDFLKAPVTLFNNLVVEIRTDSYGTETTWNIKNETNTTVASGGPYTNSVATHTQNINLPVGNYTLTINDSYGDGFPGGYLKLLAGSESIIYIEGNSFSSTKSKLFKVTSLVHLAFIPEDGSIGNPPDETFTISSGKRLFVNDWVILNNENIADFTSLKLDDVGGENVPFTATIDGSGKIITISTDQDFVNGQVLYLELSEMVRDEDGLAPENLSSTFTINFYNLTYSAGINGELSGDVNQTVNYGEDGTPVTAIPNPTYHFVKWSDDITSNPRTDVNVTADINVTAEFAINSYTLSYTAGNGGSITGSALQTVTHGSDGTPVTAVPNTGYHFVRWSDNLADNPRTDINVVANIAVTAEFAINQYILTYTAGAGGTIEGVSPQTVNHGTNGTLVTAIPNTGYHFVKWSDGVLTESRRDMSVSSDISVTAEFAINTYALTYTAGEGGTITGELAQTVNYNSGGTQVEAIPNSGYYFASWSDGKTLNPRTDLNVISDINVTANFAQTGTFYITLVSNPLNSGVLSGGGQYASGSTAAVSAESNVGYSFISWTENSLQVSELSEYSFTVFASRILTGNFQIQSFVLTYLADEHGTISGESSQSVQFGSSGSAVTAVPNAGYHFVKWSDDATDNPRIDVNVTENLTVTAEFEINTYTLTYSAGENGSLTGESTQTVNHGSNGTAVAAVPNEGYHFVQWSDGITNNPRTDINVTANISVDAEFEINTYTLSYTADENGTISGESVQAVDHGSDGMPVTAVPNEGYSFLMWSDSVVENPRTDKVVTSNISVVAEFSINTYTLSYSAGENGTILGISPQTVNHGENGSEVVAAPNSGYHFVEWSDGNTDNPRIDKNITANIDVIAEFALNTYTLALSVNPVNTGVVTGSGVYELGQEVNVTATPNEGYEFVNWTNENFDTISVEPTYTFSMPSSSLTYTANFKEENTEPETFAVSFLVTNILDQGIEGAFIAIEGFSEVLVTNSEGEAEIHLQNGEYNYSITANNFQISTGSFAVNGMDNLVEIQLIAVSVETNFLSSVMVFPNPFSNTFTLKNVNAISRMVIYNSIGQRVFERKISGVDEIVKMNDLAKGIYFLYLQAKNGEIRITKVIKE